MSNCIFRKDSGARISELITLEVFVTNFMKWPDPILANVIGVVEALFEFRRLACSAALATTFDLDLLDSRMRRPANQNSYHQYLPRFDRDMFLGILP